MFTLHYSRYSISNDGIRGTYAYKRSRVETETNRTRSVVRNKQYDTVRSGSAPLRAPAPLLISPTHFVCLTDPRLAGTRTAGGG